MPYPITIFKSQPFSDQFSTLITADQCLTLWYMFSHNWRSTVLSFLWSLSTIFQNHYVKRIMGYVGLIRCPIWRHPIFSRPPYISWGRTRLNQLALTKFGRRFRYPIKQRQYYRLSSAKGTANKKSWERGYVPALVQLFL